MPTDTPTRTRRLVDFGRRRLSSYRASFTFVGLIVATLFFCASVTPSLLPRPPIIQGLLSGFAIAIGYGVGNLLVAIYRFLELKEPSGPPPRKVRWSIIGMLAVTCVVFLGKLADWQNSIRTRMEMAPLETGSVLFTLCVALVWAAVLVAGFRLFVRLAMWLSEKLECCIPRRISRTIGFTTVLVVGLILSNDLVLQNLLGAADRFFLNIDTLVDDKVPEPTDDRTGGEESLVDWESIGRQGKLFITTGPTREEIEELTGDEALDPIRVYVGMRTAETMEERAELALAELKRVGAFERSKLVVATPTGTGWLDPSAVDTLEYLHRGDTAIVSTQYSYLPSWITILIDPRRSIESAQALFAEVYGYWTTLPEDERPDLYLYGLSLGSLGSESASELGLIFEDPIQGAVLSGPPFPSVKWNSYIRQRKEGTPARLPELGDGRLLRFTNQTNHLNGSKPWGPLRIVYVQYASDPMVWFSPDLAWRRPDWMREPRGDDVSPELRWYPIVTFLQIACDLPMATAVPLGYGHNYSPSSYIDAWVAVTAPDDWNDALTRKLKADFKTRAAPAAL